jgi:hypothetical protein
VKLRPSVRTVLIAGGAMCAVLAVADAGLVAAQPAQPPAAPPQETAPAPKAAPKAAEEAAPPAAAPPLAPTPAAPAPDKEAAPPPEPETPKTPPAPLRRARYDVAVLQALDKVTAESLRFEARVGQPVRYKSLIFTVKACERSAPDEAVDDSIAYVAIDSQPRATADGAPLAPKPAFRGWMYASSPSLHPLEHPVYDAWLITCRAAFPVSPPPASAR